MSVYKQFKTNEELEQKGIILDYGEFRITVARAGGKNKRYSKLIEAKTKPYRRAIQTGILPPEKANELLYEVYAETIILKWESLVEGKWKEGIVGETGELVKANKQNIVKIFKDLPEFFAEVNKQTSEMSLFKEEVLEEDSKN